MESRADRISVIIPTFNDCDNLARCLAAVTLARQDRTIVVMVVDDGSHDATGEVARRFAVPCVRSKTNRGQSWARNHGASLVASEYLLFVDSDALVGEDCFRRIEAFLDTNPPDDVVGLQGVFSLEHPNRGWASLIYNTMQHLLSRTPYYSAGVNTSVLLIRRDAFLQIGGFREDVWFMEDNEFGLRMAALGKCVVRGVLEFVHLKNVSWFWLARTHILGGEMLGVLEKIRARREPDSAAGRPARANRFLARWLLPLPLVIGAGLLFPLIPRTYLAFAALALLLALLPYAREAGSLLKVRRNPLFLAVGILVFSVVPWLVAVGRLKCKAFGVDPRARTLWQGQRLEKEYG